MPPEILIVGIGNVLLGDDGVGVHAARRLALHPPPEVCVLDGGTDFLALLPHLEACDVAVVIDALDAGGPPGTIYRGTVGDLAAPEARRSLHEFGLLGVLHLLPEHRRPEIVILGVQPETLRFGLELSPSVEAALPRVTDCARAVVRETRTADAN